MADTQEEGRAPAVDSDAEMYNPDDMPKDTLVGFALAQFGADLDPSKPVKELRAEVKALLNKARKQEGLPPIEKAKKVEPKKAGDGKAYLKHPENGRVYPWTPHLHSRKDMLPCDKDGNLI